MPEPQPQAILEIDLGEHGDRLSFKNYEELRRWNNNEHNQWQWMKEAGRPMTDWAVNSQDEFYNQIEQLAYQWQRVVLHPQEVNHVFGRIRNIFDQYVLQKRRLIFSTNPAATFIQGLREKRGDRVAAGAYAGILSAQINTGGQTQSDFFEGITGPSVAALPSNFSWPHFWLTADDLHRSAGTYAVSGEDCLAFTLVGMLLGNFGWNFALPPKGSDWRKLAAASPRDDWSTLINYLLAQTFAKPLSTAQAVSMGRLRRGQEDVVHLATTNPAGQRMFFIGHGLTDSTTAQYFGGGLDNDADDWQEANPDEILSFGDGGDSTDGGEQLFAAESPEGGPISAILFEVGG